MTSRLASAAKLLLVAICLLLAAPTDSHAYQVITSTGPLTRIIVGEENLQCQAYSDDDEDGEFYGGELGSCGTYLGVGGPSANGGSVYGYNEGNTTIESFSPVSQTGVSGSGTPVSPYRVQTTVAAGDSGLSVTQTDSYVTGAQSFLSAAAVHNSTASAQTVVLYHGADCDLGTGTGVRGYGHYDEETGGIFCSMNADNTPPGRLQGFVPGEGGSHYNQSNYGTNWQAVSSGLALQNNCQCSAFQDNGMAISWTLTVPAGQTVTRNWSTNISGGGVIEVGSYVALGDSVSAGEGIGYGWDWNATARHWAGGGEPGMWLSDQQSTGCHQHADGHPRLLARDLRARLRHHACTGARTFNGILASMHDDDGNLVQTAQLGSTYPEADPHTDEANPAYDNAKPDVVSLSLGANDVQFADLVKRCYIPDVGGLLQCGRRTGEQSDLDKLVADAKSNVVKVLGEIVRRGQAAGKVPVVALTQYIDPFPASYPSDGSCIDINPRVGGRPVGFHLPGLSLTLAMTGFEMTYLRLNLKRLNRRLAEAAAMYPNVVLVAPPASFGQHRWCTSDPWVYGPSIKFMGLPFGSNHESKAPFHPTAAGQNALRAQIDSRIGARRQVSAGARVPVSFANGTSLILDQVNTPGVAFFNTLGLNPNRSGERRPQRQAAARSDELPPPSAFAPVAFYSAGISAQVSGGIDVRVPAQGASALYQLRDGAWQQVPSTVDAGYLSAQLDSLGPLAVGDPVAPVNAAFALSPNHGLAPAKVSFDAATSSGPLSAFTWDFGDGTTGTGETVSHTYASSGEYEVTLRVSSDEGAAHETERTVTVRNAAPVAQMAVPGELAVNQPGAFTAAGSSDPNGPLAGAAWDFGDGSELQGGLALDHAYARAGTYTVTATVFDEEGEQTQARANITVRALPPATAPPNATPTLPARALPAAVLRIGPSVRRDRRGRLRVRVRCAAGRAACRGTLTVTQRGKPKLKLATARLRLPAGTSKLLRLKPSRRALRRLGGRKVKLTLRARLADGGVTLLNTRARMPRARR